MKVFLKEHTRYIITFYSGYALLLLVIWLDGYRDLRLYFYGFVMSTLLIMLFLASQYSRQKRLYAFILSDKENYHSIKGDPSMMSHLVYRSMDRMGQQYDQDTKKVTHRLEEQQQFMQQWVHQMKIPLAKLQGSMEETKIDRYSVDEELDKMAEGLDLALSMARLDAFKQDFVIAPISLEKLVTSSITHAKKAFTRQGIQPVVTIEKGLIIHSDVKWLSFCLSQIISNSLKYTEGEEKHLFITGKQVSNGRVCLTIEDEGVGIVSSDLPKVSQPFFTGQMGQQQQKTTGMGLYLTHDILGKLHHAMEIQSVEGKGTTVTLFF